MGINYSKNLIPKMTSDTTPSGIASASSINSGNWSPWKAFNGTVDLMASAWISTTFSSSEWIRYDFPSAEKVVKYSIVGLSDSFTTASPKSWRFEGSNDGVDWIVLDTQNNQIAWTNNERRQYLLKTFSSYNCYRLSITQNNGHSLVGVAEMALYKMQSDKILLLSGDGKAKSIEKGGYKTKNAIPAMTSNTTPSGVVFSSSDNTNAYNVFDGVNTTGLQITTANGGGKYIYGYMFDSPKSIGKYSLMLTSNASLAPKSWTFEGSNNGVDYHILDTVIGETTWENGTYKDYETDTSKPYLYYRINIAELNDSTNSRSYIYEFRMFESLPNKMEQVSSQSEQAFIHHGISQSELASIDMSADFTEKHYVQDVSTVLGEGKVFEQVLDANKVLKKISMK